MRSELLRLEQRCAEYDIDFPSHPSDEVYEAALSHLVHELELIRAFVREASVNGSIRDLERVDERLGAARDRVYSRLQRSAR